MTLEAMCASVFRGTGLFSQTNENSRGSGIFSGIPIGLGSVSILCLADYLAAWLNSAFLSRTIFFAGPPCRFGFFDLLLLVRARVLLFSPAMMWWTRVSPIDKPATLLSTSHLEIGLSFVLQID